MPKASRWAARRSDRRSSRSLITIVWCGVVSAILYKVVDLIVGLRPTVEAEREGLDLTSHGEVAYHSCKQARPRTSNELVRQQPPRVDLLTQKENAFLWH
jgi:hypothetical protein